MLCVVCELVYDRTDVCVHGVGRFVYILAALQVGIIVTPFAPYIDVPLTFILMLPRGCDAWRLALRHG